jgi:hypothetical protein
VLDFLFRPLRSALDTGERVISKPLEEPEHELTVFRRHTAAADPATTQLNTDAEDEQPEAPT